MNRCWSCGRDGHAAHAFCPRCGARHDDAPEDTPADTAEEAAAKLPQTRSRWLPVAAALVALATLGGIVWWATAAPSESDDAGSALGALVGEVATSGSVTQRDQPFRQIDQVRHRITTVSEAMSGGWGINPAERFLPAPALRGLALYIRTENDLFTIDLGVGSVDSQPAPAGVSFGGEALQPSEPDVWLIMPGGSLRSGPDIASLNPGQDGPSRRCELGAKWVTDLPVVLCLRERSIEIVRTDVTTNSSGIVAIYPTPVIVRDPIVEVDLDELPLTNG